MRSRRPRGLRQDEIDLWEKVRQNTTPLHRLEVPDSVKIEAPAKPTIAAFEVQPFKLGSFSNGAALTNPPPATTQSVAMDKKKYDQLVRGKLSPEAKLDLHGHTLDRAHPALIGFIMAAHQNGKRLVLVVTGKGKPGNGPGSFPMQGGILQSQVPRWLAENPLRGLVLQTKQAHGKHGGGGALYVYLRRRR